MPDSYFCAKSPAYGSQAMSSISRRFRVLPHKVYRFLARTAQLALLTYRLSGSPITVRSLLNMIRAKAGMYSRTCPICGYEGLFDLTIEGNPPRWISRCPSCTSGERNRLLFIAFKSLQVNRASTILHFAPERCLESWFRTNYDTYVTADLNPKRADLKFNIEEIKLNSESTDVVLCSHVLEHVNDRKALSELFRILKPEGVLLAMVPIVEGWQRTYEDPAIVTPKDRWIHYGRVDHLRFYGADFRERVRAAGFQISECTAEGREAAEHGLIRGEKVFVCRKSAPVGSA